MSFENSFKTWLRESLDKPIPKSVRAFAFNLYEFDSDDSPFGIDFIGSPDFDVEDSDWACEQVWESTPRTLLIPVHFSTESWETCLANVKALVLRTLGDTHIGQILQTREAIGIGFAAGDLELVWQR